MSAFVRMFVSIPRSPCDDANAGGACFVGI
jgi:hypothetical protein